MGKELPSSVSVHDAAALILNMSYLPGTNDLIDMISHFREEAGVERDNATDPGEREKYNCQAIMHLCREGLARSLIEAIELEFSAISAGKESILEIDENAFGSEKFKTTSILAWAENIGFGIQGWKMPAHWRKKNRRTYSTEFLDIIDDVIATFCEEGGENYSPDTEPRNYMIVDYIKEKYGPLSEKIMTSIPTIVRPGVTYSTKKE
jgi:hypothetical protein